MINTKNSQSLIRSGHVRVNGRPGRASLRLKTGDRVRLEVPDATAPSELTPEDLPLAVVYEDDHLIVIDKPPGLVVHPGAGVTRGTLANALLHHHPAIAGVGGERRPGIVHRLDKDTSGLMVAAKTGRAHRALVEAIGARAVRRVYRALVWGDPAQESGRVSAAIGRHPRDRKRMAVVSRGGRPASSAWEVLERFGLATLARVRLETGRTHQIRVHMAHLGHPVVGDPAYGGRSKKLLSLGERRRSLARTLLERLPRQALHASELGFIHPITGNELHFTAPDPDDLRKALDLLRAVGQEPRGLTNDARP